MARDDRSAIIAHRRGPTARWTGLAFALVFAVHVNGMRTREAEAKEPPSGALATARGRQLFRAACATCHGEDGRGATEWRTEIDLPMPDFTDCGFAQREANLDWLATIHRGGPARGFDERMPAFEEALTEPDIDRVVAYMRTLCTDHDWPRGELNLPRALLTEKAFVEDEAVLTSEIALRGRTSVNNELLYEKRFGARNQLELSIPFGVQERAPNAAGESGGTIAGVGDIAVGVKRALFHSIDSGSIVSAMAELFLPTGSEQDGFGRGTFAFEPSLLYGQVIPVVGFAQFQAGVELPFDASHVKKEGYVRALIGHSFMAGRFGRMWSPMFEVMALRELERGASTDWDYVPQLQAWLSRRGHVRANAGLRVPLTSFAERPTTLMLYLLWDWYDGGLLEGW